MQFSPSCFFLSSSQLFSSTLCSHTEKNLLVFFKEESAGFNKWMMKVCFLDRMQEDKGLVSELLQAFPARCPGLVSSKLFVSSILTCYWWPKMSEHYQYVENSLSAFVRRRRQESIVGIVARSRRRQPRNWGTVPGSGKSGISRSCARHLHFSRMSKCGVISPFAFVAFTGTTVLSLYSIVPWRRNMDIHTEWLFLPLKRILELRNIN
jgi:hypothetical protein